MMEPGAAADWRQLDPELAIDDPALASLLAFWHRLRGTRELPARDDFMPDDLVDHLGWVILIDVEPAPRRYRFRLVGSGITAALARDSTGRYMDELYGPEIYAEAVRPYDHVVEHRRPVRSVGRMVHANREHIPYEAIYLPFSPDGRQVDIVLERVKYEGLA